MKYGKGRKVNGKWVFGGVQRDNKKCFFRVVESRTKEELLKVIHEWILSGTTIISDCWKSYDCLSDEGYVHLRVNHSLNFVDPETSAHTNSIEGNWSAIKKGLHKAHVKGQFDSYLAEYMWRRSNGHKLVNDNFHDFLSSIARVYPPTERKRKVKISVTHNLGMRLFLFKIADISQVSKMTPELQPPSLQNSTLKQCPSFAVEVTRKLPYSMGLVCLHIRVFSYPMTQINALTSTKSS
ncbi:putative isxo2-like transposase domain protein [Trichonephila clavipes]|nr:putative isxo2-like transposase domain protein [Trichonephila clavipes]